MAYDRMRVFIDPLGEYLDGYRQAEQDEIKAQLAYREARAADQEFDFREAADPLKLRQLEADLDGMLLQNQQRQRDYDLGYGLRHDPYAAALSSARASAARRAGRGGGGGATPGRYTTRAAPGQAAPAVGGDNAVGPDGAPIQTSLPVNSPDRLASVSETTLQGALADPTLPADARGHIEAELARRGGPTGTLTAPIPVETTALPPAGGWQPRFPGDVPPGTDRAAPAAARQPFSVPLSDPTVPAPAFVHRDPGASPGLSVPGPALVHRPAYEAPDLTGPLPSGTGMSDPTLLSVPPGISPDSWVRGTPAEREEILRRMGRL